MESCYEVPVQLDTVILAGLIESSLWFADLSGEVWKLGEDEFSEYVFDLADVFAWKVDFTRDIRAVTRSGWRSSASDVRMERSGHGDSSRSSFGIGIG